MALVAPTARGEAPGLATKQPAKQPMKHSEREHRQKHQQKHRQRLPQKHQQKRFKFDWKVQRAQRRAQRKKEAEVKDAHAKVPGDGGPMASIGKNGRETPGELEEPLTPRSAEVQRMRKHIAGKIKGKPSKR